MFVQNLRAKNATVLVGGGVTAVAVAILPNAPRKIAVENYLRTPMKYFRISDHSLVQNFVLHS